MPPGRWCHAAAAIAAAAASPAQGRAFPEREAERARRQFSRVLAPGISPSGDSMKGLKFQASARSPLFFKEGTIFQARQTARQTQRRHPLQKLLSGNFNSLSTRAKPSRGLEAEDLPGTEQPSAVAQEI